MSITELVERIKIDFDIPNYHWVPGENKSIVHRFVDFFDMLNYSTLPRRFLTFIPTDNTNKFDFILNDIDGQEITDEEYKELVKKISNLPTIKKHSRMNKIKKLSSN